MQDNSSEDAVFRYPLSSLEVPDRGAAKHSDELVELFRRQVVNLLDVVELTCEGNIVKVDGFVFLSDLDTVYELFDSG